MEEQQQEKKRMAADAQQHGSRYFLAKQF